MKLTHTIVLRHALNFVLVDANVEIPLSLSIQFLIIIIISGSISPRHASFSASDS